MKRIRYIQSDRGENIVESTKILVSETTGARYKVYLDLENRTYAIKNIHSERLLKGGENINNMNVLKRTVKKRLSSMGVNFDNEVRDRSFGRCPKGYSQEIHENKDEDDFKRYSC